MIKTSKSRSEVDKKSSKIFLVFVWCLIRNFVDTTQTNLVEGQKSTLDSVKTSNCVCKQHRAKGKTPDPVVKDLISNNKNCKTNNKEKRSALLFFFPVEPLVWKFVM